MRRISLLALLLLCCLLTACSSVQTYDGTWQTPSDEARSTTSLVLASDGTFILVQEGVTYTGGYFIANSAITLTAEPLHTDLCMWRIDPQTRAISMGDGLYLYPVN